MADLKCITSPIVVTESRCYTKYMGTREELVSAGIAQDHHFAEGRKRVKYFDTDTDDFCSTRKIKGGKFELVKHHAPRWPQGQENTPKKRLSREEYRDRIVSFSNMTLHLLASHFDAHDEEEGEFSLDANSLEVIACAQAQIKAAINSSKIVLRNRPQLTIVKN